jgi:hypothetical protein
MVGDELYEVVVMREQQGGGRRGSSNRSISLTNAVDLNKYSSRLQLQFFTLSLLSHLTHMMRIEILGHEKEG